MNKPATAILSVRVTAEERALLEAAAEDARTSLSDFVRRKAVEAAEMEILNRTSVTIPAEDWDAFMAWVHEPPKEMPELKRLAAIRPVWER